MEENPTPDQTPDSRELPKPETRFPAGGRDWLPDEAVESLVMERTVHPSESEEEMANRMFKEALPLAVQAVIHISQHDMNSRVRLSASQYIIERNLGRIDDVNRILEEDPLMALVSSVVRVDKAVAAS